jgi:hypothetical protein
MLPGGADIPQISHRGYAAPGGGRRVCMGFCRCVVLWLGRLLGGTLGVYLFVCWCGLVLSVFAMRFVGLGANFLFR